MSSIHAFEPIFNVRVGEELAIPTFEVVTIAAHTFVKRATVVPIFPIVKTFSRDCDPVTPIVLIPCMLPSAFTVRIGICDELPYIV